MTKKSTNALQAVLNRASAETGQAVPVASAAPLETAPPAVAGRKTAPARAGKKLISGHFAPEVSQQLRMVAVEEDTTVQALLEEAIADLLVKKAARKVLR